MGTQGQGANPQPGDRGRKAFSSSQHRCTSPGHRRPWWKDLRWTGGKDTLPRAPVCADRGERCQMGHLKNLQQQVGGQPWTSERHSGSCALEFTGRQSPGRKKHRVYKSSAPCVSSSGGMLCYPWAKLLPPDTSNKVPLEATHSTSVLLTQTTSAFTSGNHFRSLSGAPSSNAGGKASAFESE